MWNAVVTSLGHEQQPVADDVMVRHLARIRELEDKLRATEVALAVEKDVSQMSAARCAQLEAALEANQKRQERAKSTSAETEAAAEAKYTALQENAAREKAAGEKLLGEADARYRTLLAEYEAFKIDATAAAQRLRELDPNAIPAGSPLMTVADRERLLSAELAASLQAQREEAERVKTLQEAIARLENEVLLAANREKGEVEDHQHLLQRVRELELALQTANEALEKHTHINPQQVLGDQPTGVKRRLGGIRDMFFGGPKPAGSEHASTDPQQRIRELESRVHQLEEALAVAIRSQKNSEEKVTKREKKIKTLEERNKDLEQQSEHYGDTIIELRKQVQELEDKVYEDGQEHSKELQAMERKLQESAKALPVVAPAPAPPPPPAPAPLSDELHAVEGKLVAAQIALFDAQKKAAEFEAFIVALGEDPAKRKKISTLAGSSGADSAVAKAVRQVELERQKVTEALALPKIAELEQALRNARDEAELERNELHKALAAAAESTQRVQIAEETVGELNARVFTAEGALSVAQDEATKLQETVVNLTGRVHELEDALVAEKENHASEYLLKVKELQASLIEELSEGVEEGGAAQNAAVGQMEKLCTKIREYGDILEADERDAATKRQGSLRTLTRALHIPSSGDRTKAADARSEYIVLLQDYSQELALLTHQQREAAERTKLRKRRAAKLQETMASILDKMPRLSEAESAPRQLLSRIRELEAEASAARDAETELRTRVRTLEANVTPAATAALAAMGLRDVSHAVLRIRELQSLLEREQKKVKAAKEAAAAASAANTPPPEGVAAPVVSHPPSPIDLLTGESMDVVRATNDVNAAVAAAADGRVASAESRTVEMARRVKELEIQLGTSRAEEAKSHDRIDELQEALEALGGRVAPGTGGSKRLRDAQVALMEAERKQKRLEEQLAKAEALVKTTVAEKDREAQRALQPLQKEVTRLTTRCAELEDLLRAAQAAAAAATTRKAPQPPPRSANSSDSSRNDEPNKGSKFSRFKNFMGSIATSVAGDDKDTEIQKLQEQLDAKTEELEEKEVTLKTLQKELKRLKKLSGASGGSPASPMSGASGTPFKGAAGERVRQLEEALAAAEEGRRIDATALETQAARVKQLEEAVREALDGFKPEEEAQPLLALVKEELVAVLDASASFQRKKDSCEKLVARFGMLEALNDEPQPLRPRTLEALDKCCKEALIAFGRMRQRIPSLKVTDQPNFHELNDRLDAAIAMVLVDLCVKGRASRDALRSRLWKKPRVRQPGGSVSGATSGDTRSAGSARRLEDEEEDFPYWRRGGRVIPGYEDPSQRPPLGAGTSGELSAPPTVSSARGPAPSAGSVSAGGGGPDDKPLLRSMSMREPRRTPPMKPADSD